MGAHRSRQEIETDKKLTGLHQKLRAIRQDYAQGRLSPSSLWVRMEEFALEARDVQMDLTPKLEFEVIGILPPPLGSRERRA